MLRQIMALPGSLQAGQLALNASATMPLRGVAGRLQAHSALTARVS